MKQRKCTHGSDQRRDGAQDPEGQRSQEDRWMLWFVWQFEEQQQKLDDLSKQGIHLVHARTWRGTYVRDPALRYVYRLDYQPLLEYRPTAGRRDRQREYLALYRDAGWEYIGKSAGWHYFRRPWTEADTPELYTDRTSLLTFYQRIQYVLCFLFIAELVGLLVNAYNLLILNRVLPKWTTVVPLLMVYAGLVLLLGYGFVKIHQRVRRMKRG
ncbi:DUF2812 domain-containing protein [Alicyclobacillus cycloheptanicus]|uniref:DUF2812 domain-containing protein n=1 Tax=Alicyclobacillus cycloheptanicus TaxID=1457 RepID=A0ABT9XKT4_9BACL|nr:DUF2812 domain-containing protein [Alicyclobacillus cycloheptanicus]MDQ0190890.1 hypothetical protein [Alicyclobacillus cycloheptanicus]WDM01776.1 DUF2812 domain-containing protein [Alicyclobacillus cycloheptanicus]